MRCGDWPDAGAGAADNTGAKYNRVRARNTTSELHILPQTCHFTNAHNQPLTFPTNYYDIGSSNTTISIIDNVSYSQRELYSSIWDDEDDDEPMDVAPVSLDEDTIGAKYG